jgi:hypothetical protein
MERYSKFYRLGLLSNGTESEIRLFKLQESIKPDELKRAQPGLPQRPDDEPKRHHSGDPTS